MAEHHHQLAQPARRGGVDGVLQHRAPADGQQLLGAAHPRARARGEDQGDDAHAARIRSAPMSVRLTAGVASALWAGAAALALHERRRAPRPDAEPPVRGGPR